MTWQEAKDNTLQNWYAIRDSIGTADPLDLLVEINVVMGLCEMAEEEAGGPWNRCQYCLFYEQFGGCQEISGRMSELTVSKEWDELRDLVSEFIRRLEVTKVKPSTGGRSIRPERHGRSTRSDRPFAGDS